MPPQSMCHICHGLYCTLTQEKKQTEFTTKTMVSYSIFTVKTIVTEIQIPQPFFRRSPSCDNHEIFYVTECVAPLKGQLLALLLAAFF